MSGTLRLLGECEGDVDGLIKLCLPQVKTAEMGKIPVFWDECVGEDLEEVASFVSSSELAGRINGIDLRDRFSLVMVCDKKYLLQFGDYSEVDAKLRVAAAVLRDDMFKTENKAKINLSNLTETSVIVDNRLDFEKLIGK